MFKFRVVVREPGRLMPDYSLEFEAPVLPRESDYLSVQRPDHERPFGEDMIVAKVWWRLAHPEVGPFQREPLNVGSLEEIIVECVAAVSPYSSDQWRDSLARVGAPEMEVSRFVLRESEIAVTRDSVAEAIQERSGAFLGAVRESDCQSDCDCGGLGARYVAST